MTGLSDAARQLAAWNDERHVPMSTRILKLAEETGEATQAWLGYTGGNPRKGFTHDQDALVSELGDVALAAMVALASLGRDAEAEVNHRAAFVLARLANVSATPSATHPSYYSSPAHHTGRREDCRICPPPPCDVWIDHDGQARPITERGRDVLAELEHHQHGPTQEDTR